MINKIFVPAENKEYELVVTKFNHEWVHVYAFNHGYFKSKNTQSWISEKVTSLLKALDMYDEDHTDLGTLIIDAQSCLYIPVVGYFEKIGSINDIHSFRPIIFRDFKERNAA